MTTNQAPSGKYRPLTDSAVEQVTDARENSDGGYYDPTDGEVYPSFNGEVYGPEGDTIDPDDENWIVIPTDDSRDEYQDMALFAEAVTEPVLADRLARSLDGRGAFGRFKNDVHNQEPIGDEEFFGKIWSRFSEARQAMRSIEWLLEEDLCDEAEAAAALKVREAKADQALADAAAWHM